MSLFSMKRIVIWVLVLLFALPMYSQSFRRRHSAFEDGDDYHFAYISGSVGYAMLQTRLPNAMPHGGVGGGVGLGYEFRNSGFWANIGLQLSFHRSKLILDPYERLFSSDPENDIWVRDTQGKDVTLVYNVTQTDEVEWNYIDVPLMVGYYVRGFHVGAGLKISYAFNAQTRSHGTFSLSGRYDTYPEDFHDMPDRGYTSYEFDNRVKNELNVGASLIGEVGYDLLSSMPTRSRTCHVLKLAFYFEYGLNTQIHQRETAIPSIVHSSTESVKPGAEVTINPYMNTFTKPARTVPFFTGVKLTYMIGGSRTARAGSHHGCMCYN